MTTSTHDHQSVSAWKRFWERGGWWKALLLVAVYDGLYQLAGFVTLPFAGVVGERGSALSVVIDTGLPIFIGCVLLVILAWSVGWLRELFGRQAIRGSGWMWVAVVVVLGTNILRFITLDGSEAGLPRVLAWLLTGLLIGFAEEVLTRGFVVQLMRRAGHPEIAVALVSAALFAALHAGNFFTGQGVVATVLQVAYTFFFGILMYLAYRVSRWLIVPVLLHATTDPSIFLLAEYPAAGSLASIAGFGNIVVTLAGLVLMIVLIFTGGRERAFPRERVAAADPQAAEIRG